MVSDTVVRGLTSSAYASMTQALVKLCVICTWCSQLRTHRLEARSFRTTTGSQLVLVDSQWLPPPMRSASVTCPRETGVQLCGFVPQANLTARFVLSNVIRVN